MFLCSYTVPGKCEFNEERSWLLRGKFFLAGVEKRGNKKALNKSRNCQSANRNGQERCAACYRKRLKGVSRFRQRCITPEGLVMPTCFVLEGQLAFFPSVLAQLGRKNGIWLDTGGKEEGARAALLLTF